MRILADGTWLHEGSPIGRIAMVRLFSTVLRREPDGGHVLVTPVEKLSIAVDDAPFVVVEMTSEGEGDTRRLAFRTNVGDLVVAGPEHPLTLEDRGHGEHPYLRVRGGLDALVARPVYYELANLAIDEPAGPSGAIGLWSDGAFFRWGKRRREADPELGRHDPRAIRGDARTCPRRLPATASSIARASRCRAAVLAAIVDRPEPGLLLTRRNEALRNHAGQIAFAGGRADPGDSGPVDTALREAWEEIAMPRDAVTVIGCDATYLTITHFAIVPVVGIVPARSAAVPLECEVADIFEVPLEPCARSRQPSPARRRVPRRDAPLLRDRLAGSPHLGRDRGDDRQPLATAARMTDGSGPPAVEDADALAALVAALDGGADGARYIGGWVRDTLLGLDPQDIDVATRLAPQEAERRAKDGGARRHGPRLRGLRTARSAC